MPEGHFLAPSNKVETPSAVYKAARGEWSEFVGPAIVEARRWRAMSFILAFALTGVSGAFAWHASQSSVAPYMVKVNNLGETAAAGLIPPLPPADPPRIRNQLVTWISDVRSVYGDAYAERNVATQAYGYVDRKSSALAQLNEWFRSNDPNERAKLESVSVDVESVTQQGADTWFAQFREDHVPRDGRPMYFNFWSASIRVRAVQPKTKEEEDANPNGIYITEFHFAHRNVR